VILPASWQKNKILSLAGTGNKKKIDSVLCGIERSRFLWSNQIKFLQKFESKLKTALSQESGDPGIPFKEKNRGSKIL
jgi:hypothetical protein